MRQLLMPVGLRIAARLAWSGTPHLVNGAARLCMLFYGYSQCKLQKVNSCENVTRSSPMYRSAISTAVTDLQLGFLELPPGHHPRTRQSA